MPESRSSSAPSDLKTLDVEWYDTTVALLVLSYPPDAEQGLGGLAPTTLLKHPDAYGGCPVHGAHEANACGYVEFADVGDERPVLVRAGSKVLVTPEDRKARLAATAERAEADAATSAAHVDPTLKADGIRATGLNASPEALNGLGGPHDETHAETADERQASVRSSLGLHDTSEPYHGEGPE